MFRTDGCSDGLCLERMAVWMVCVKNGWLFGWFVLRTDGCLDGLCLERMAVWMVCG